MLSRVLLGRGVQEPALREAGIKKTFVVRDYPGPQLWRTLSHLQPELKH